MNIARGLNNILNFYYCRCQGDENAALNIENEGYRIYNETIGQRLPELTPVDYPLMDDPIGSNTEMLRSNGRLKQEEKTIYKFV